MNRKIVNATPLDYNNIHFKSKLEVTIYKALKDLGFNPMYEPYKYIVWDGFKPTIPFYIKKHGTVTYDISKQISITYTPDLVFTYGKYTIFVEVKPSGFCNDVYPYKRKLFRKFLELNKDINPIFAQLGSKREVIEFIKILKRDYEES